MEEEITSKIVKTERTTFKSELYPGIHFNNMVDVLILPTDKVGKVRAVKDQAELEEVLTTFRGPVQVITNYNSRYERDDFFRYNLNERNGEKLEGIACKLFNGTTSKKAYYNCPMN